MSESVDTIGDFTRSDLFRHMTIAPIGPEYSADLKKELLKSLGDESFSYMNGNEVWEKLKRDNR